MDFGPIVKAPKCGDDRDGSIEIHAYGGAGGYEYFWRHGPETSKITGLAPGSYQITVRDSVGCSRTRTIVLDVLSTLSAQVSVQPLQCPDDNDGAAEVEISGGVPPYRIFGSNGQIGNAMTRLAPGEHHFTITDAKGCSLVKSFSIQAPPGPSYALQVRTPTCRQRDGSIRVFSRQKLNILWADGDTSSRREGLSPGLYPLTITDERGCAIHDTVKFVPPPLPNYELQVRKASNSAESDGAVVVRCEAEVRWADGYIGNERSDLRAGRYVVELWDGKCTHAVPIDVGMEDVMTLRFKTTPPTCRGGSDGGVELTVVGGTPPYKYKWYNGATTKDLTGVPAGIYKVEVYDAEGYVARKEVTLTEPEKPLVIETSKTPTSCANAADGKASVRVVSGTPPYRYFWSTGAIIPEISGLAKGKYTVSVADGTGCTRTDTVEIKEASPMEVALAAFPVSCRGLSDGRVETSVRGGKPPYSFKWSHGATVEDPNRLAVGEYQVTVVDANGCTTTATTRIVEPPALVVKLKTQDVKCYGSETGQIVVETSGGTPPYTYKWNDGASKAERRNLKAGEYSVIVADLHGCTQSATAKIVENEALKAHVKAVNPICEGSGDGKIELTVSGGKPPYKFKWSNGATSQNLNKLGAGTYTAEITDAEGCFVSAYATLTAPEGLRVEVAVVEAGCTGMGSAEAKVVGGKPPFAFVWSNGSRNAQSGPLPEGTYTVEVQDANGCKASAKATISKAVPLKVSLKALPGLCDENDGGADSDVRGGKPPYRFAWSNGHTDAALRKVKPGTYVLTVTDADGCKAEARVDIPRLAPLKVTYTALHNLCNASADGSIDLKVEGGKAPYSFKWSHGPVSEDVSGLAKGKYNVVVSDANACTVQKEIEIQQAPPIEIKLKVKDVTCKGAGNGEIEADVVNAAPPVTYTWSHGANTKDLKNLKAGKYKLTVSDANRCSLVKEVEVREPENLTLMLSTLNATCGSDGAANVNVSGGVPPYKIVWSNGAETKEIKNLGAGIYTVTVTDAAGCTKTAAATIESPGALSVVLDASPPSCGKVNGKIAANVKGGTPPYTYLWNTGAKTSAVDNLAPGNYQLTVTDAAGCSTTKSQTLAGSAELKLTLVGTNPSCAKPEGKIDLAVTGGVPPYKYAWNNGATSEDLSGLAEGKYSVTVTDAAGCTARAEYAVVYPPPLKIKYTAEPPVCGEANGKITLDVQGTNVKIKWADGSDKPKLENLPAGIYTVTVADANGCTASETIELRGGQALKATLKIKQPRCGAPDGAIEVSVEGGQKPYKLSWNHDKKAEYSLSGLPAGVYTLTVSDGAGCKTIETVELINTPALTVNVKGTNPSCGAADGKAEVVVSGGIEPFAYRWNTGATSPKIEKLDGGEYTVTVTDKMGCTATAGVKLEKPSALGVTAKVT
ncbi:MAG: SprB repeat-containing protein, partial [Bacteroidia bacterium]|nr:SprB repeat-containing protein [Bacteroidia bacterium]